MRMLRWETLVIVATAVVLGTAVTLLTLTAFATGMIGSPRRTSRPSRPRDRPCRLRAGVRARDAHHRGPLRGIGLPPGGLRHVRLGRSAGVRHPPEGGKAMTGRIVMGVLWA
ncbi:hypothetical protein [Actinoallomurus rhizosphaericola]|uniref:hypothetical protein n=1 Tax=Actinoallomurus rhizosphaericola TaxID=2952536 RepID=UPI003873AAA1